MSKQIELKIVTPEKVLYQGLVDSVSLPTMEGEITILPDHIPIISAIKAGELKMKIDGKYQYFSITRGVAEVDGKTITLLTDAAESVHEIDEKRAQEAKERAQAIMSEKRHDEESYADAVVQMERALSRIKIAKKRSRGQSSTSSQQ
ncbi:ATP synthase F1 subunit epsilon [Candidatus Peregrinibacteria bacterium]|nr:ATP synthase F1 subunit epsilon [Candidatus Peregrinibacteria bacterium]